MFNANQYTKKSIEALQGAADLAKKYNHGTVEPEHLLIALSQQAEGIVPRLIENLNFKPILIVRELESAIQKFPTVTGSTSTPGASQRFQKLMTEAEKVPGLFGDSYLSTEHLFLAALKSHDDKIEKLFKNFNISEAEVIKVIKSMKGGQTVQDEEPESKMEVLKKYGRDLTALAAEGKLDPVVGRDEEIRRVIQVLSRRTKNNPVLIGEPGVGKTAIAEGLAVRLVKKDVPESLIGRTLISLDLGSLIAGAKYRGEFEDRLKAVIKEVTASNGQIILFIDEIHTLVGAGKSEGAMDAGQLLKPALARGELRCIGATTLDEYRKYIEKDAALERRFQTVLVDEPSVEDAITILRGLKEKYELHHGVNITDSALVAAVKLSHRYITSRFLPDKAIDLIDEAASKMSIEIDSVPEELDSIERKIFQFKVEQEALKKEKDPDSTLRLEILSKELSSLEKSRFELRSQWEQEKGALDEIKKIKEQIDKTMIEVEKAERSSDLGKAAALKYGTLPDLEKKLQALGKSAESRLKLLKEQVEPEDIAEVVSKWTRIPVSKMLESESKKLLEMESQLQKRVIGQSHALKAVSSAIKRARAEISDPNKPIGTFLFLGPTGVGKTETVKALAEFLFDDEQAITRIDMSEYMEKHSVSRLVGAPPGYVGYDEGGQLTESVRRKPYSVVLFDEIEKAHSDVFNIMLQIFDEGRLTDGQGRTVDFRNTVLIMTSNLGSSILMDESLKRSEKDQQVQDLLKRSFKPEFLNRIDEVITFDSLDQKQTREIVRIQLGSLLKRLKEKRIDITFSELALDTLAQKGFDPLYGARPLKRVIQNELLNPLAEKLISGELKSGQKVHIEWKDSQFQFLGT